MTLPPVFIFRTKTREWQGGGPGDNLIDNHTVTEAKKERRSSTADATSTKYDGQSDNTLRPKADDEKTMFFDKKIVVVVFVVVVSDNFKQTL